MRDGQSDQCSDASVERRAEPDVLSSHYRSTGDVLAEPRADRYRRKLAYGAVGKPGSLRSGGADVSRQALMPRSTKRGAEGAAFLFIYRRHSGAHRRCEL